MTVASTRPAMPLWDEEVVPALRKRLESESKTLARKLSAISLPPGEETKNATFSDRNVNQKQIPPSPALPRLPYTSQDHKNQPSKQSSDLMSISPTTIVNGTSTKASRSPSLNKYQRTRTYSSPYASDYPDSPPNGSATPKSKPNRTTDVKPTRIPKVARQMTTPNTYRTNGYNSHSTIVTASQPPELPYRQASLEYPRSSQRDAAIPTSSSRSTFDLPRSANIKIFTTGLLQESPPFPTDSTMSSGLSQQNEDPLRPSVDSEERPYEHWYRGEVSRNGGVGELKVGRRQQMLDIANYGHLIRNKKMAITKTQPASILDESHQYHRKRAGSIGGLTRKERNSLYLDEKHADEVERVLDEDPPTDLEKEDTHSILDEFDVSTQPVAFAYVPSEADIRNSTASTAEQWTSTVGAHELRSVTPTPLARPSSRQTQNLPPSRIPGPSSRRSSDSRSTVNNSSTTSSTPVPVTRTKSSSPETVSPVPGPSSSVNLRMQAVPSSTTSSPAASTSSTPQKRGISPSVKKARPPVKKAKTVAGSKRDNRTSVAMYPTVEGGEELADAIPSWTQPIQKEGNWDEVVLPVVARKKGLDGYYESADGSPQPKKPVAAEKFVEPAPGTFGFDHSKYRPPRDNDEFIPMDEFGRPAEERQGSEEETRFANTPSTLRKEEKASVQIPRSTSPVPFSQYAPTKIKVVHSVQNAQPQPPLPDEDQNGAGCCKCVIM